MAIPITFKKVVKQFDNLRALDNVTLNIEAGELFFLLGPSGCGKTTLLRSLAGFCIPDSGSIFIGNTDVTTLPPHKRDTGMVFQSYALWPHLTLFENVAFGLQMRKISKGETHRRVMEALELVRLGDRAQAKPNQLSGGQQQRVALARALVIEPQCLLLDEPLSNLDAKLRLEMRVDIRRICKQAGITAIYVTHDQKEALSIADRLAVMRAGRLEQVGTPAEVYRSPINTFTAGFIGEGNFISGQVVADNGTTLHISTTIGAFTATARVNSPAPRTNVTLCIRPEAFRFDLPPANTPNTFSGKLNQTIYQGEVAQHEITLTRANAQWEIKAFELNPRHSTPASSTTCWVEPEQIIVLQ
ncbi:MAG: ABC transporter ATP-binding protein [Lentisphaerae bacterium]|jgi:iron(III) transport system ATP-binding protein|nr:ABC transporter ATP-binding protein [Lentisphaerota bacterium]